MKNIVLILFIILLYSIDLSSFGLTGPDEARYAEAAREMIELKSYLIPYYNYKPRLVKPPFFYWMVALSYKLFGVSEASARLVSIVFTLFCALFLIFITLHFSDISKALLAAIIFLLMPYTFTIAHLCITDPTLCFFITTSSYLLSLGVVEKKRNFIKIAYISMGLGVLTKGPVGFLIPVLSNVAFLTASGEKKKIKRMFPIFEVLVFLAISLPWFVYIYAKHLVGVNFFTKETFGRFFEGAWHKRPFYFFIPVVTFGAFPFILSFRKESLYNPLVRFSLFHFLTVFLFFSISLCKLVSYIFPAFPPLSVILAHSPKKSFLKKSMVFSLSIFILSKFIFIPMYKDRISIRPIFKGKVFERNAHFYYIKKLYKAYPFYVRKRVLELKNPEEIEYPAYILARWDRIKGIKGVKISEMVYKDHRIIFLKVKP